MTEPVLDPAIWASLRALDEDGGFIDELIDLFSDDAGRRIGSLRAAVDAGDRHAAQTTAHSLRGSAANVGASAVAALARDMEHDLDAGKSLESAAVNALSAALDDALTALAAERSRPRD